MSDDEKLIDSIREITDLHSDPEFQSLLSLVTTGESDEEIARIEQVIKALTEKDIERAELIEFLKTKIKGQQENIEYWTNHWKAYNKPMGDSQFAECENEIDKFTKIIKQLKGKEDE